MKKIILPIMIGVLTIAIVGCNQMNDNNKAESVNKVESANAETILQKDWRPRSLFKLQITEIDKAKFPVIEMHAHHYTENSKDVAERVKVMDQVGIEKSVVYTQATGAEFDSIYALYSEYSDRFDVYCGFDLSEVGEKGWDQRAVKELRRCVEKGAVGVGELVDKGAGLAEGLHPDDPRMDALWEACAELKIPVNLHMADPIWMYEDMDEYNEGLPRAWTWRVEDKETKVDHHGMMKIFSNTLERHPNTIFVAAHLANCTYDLSILGKMFDTHPNLYADLSARFAEISSIPLSAADFITTYPNRLVYATDYGWEVWDKQGAYGNNTNLDEMYHMTFRVLETKDEHFYLSDLTGYKWPMYGLGLNDAVLKSIYYDTAQKIGDGSLYDDDGNL